MRRVVIASCLLLALTACRSQEPIEPTPTPKPTATTTSAADPDLKPPTLPAQARKNTPEGAAAFVAYWVKTFNYAARTGDVEPISQASFRCKACNSYVSALKGVAARGELSKSDLWNLRSTLVTRDERIYEVSAKIKIRTSSGLSVEQIGFRIRSGSPSYLIDIYRISSE